MIWPSYVYIRAVELEGRHPRDEGAWPVTVRRMEVGEGTPPLFEPLSFVEMPDQGPLPPTPQVNRKNWNRSTYYSRLNSTGQVEACLSSRAGSRKVWVQAALKLFPGWIKPDGGIIPTPGGHEGPMELTHAIPLDDFNHFHRRMLFLNSWGSVWGKNGFGFLPYDYFDRYVFECWGAYHVEHFLHRRAIPLAEGQLLERWTIRDERGLRVYGFYLIDQASQERLGWCFVVDRGDALDVEELYVRPEFRGRRLGARLTEQVAEFLDRQDKSIRLWVPFADCRSEAPENYNRLVAIVRRLRLCFHKCPSQYAAYFAATKSWDGGGSDFPIEPDVIPQRPKGSLTSLIAAAALVLPPAANGSATSNPVAESWVNPLEVGNQAWDKKDFPEVGSEAWDEMNHRRNALIRRKVIEGIEALTEGEKREYEWLQSMSLQAVQAKFPGPTSLHLELANLRESSETGDPAK